MMVIYPTRKMIVLNQNPAPAFPPLPTLAAPESDEGGRWGEGWDEGYPPAKIFHGQTPLSLTPRLQPGGRTDFDANNFFNCLPGAETF
jgi:hypothetical protein